MSLSLVDYGSSSESEDDDQQQQPLTQENTTFGGSTGLSQLLPPPKNETSKKTSTTKKSIFYIPSAKDLEEEEEEEEKPAKRIKLGSTSSNIADLLPAPKRSQNPFLKTSATTDTTAKTNVTTSSPQSIPKVEQNKSVQGPTNGKKMDNTVDSEEEEQEDSDEEPETTTKKASTHIGPFFRLGSSLQEKPVIKPAKTTNKAENHYNDDHRKDSIETQNQQKQKQQQQALPVLEDPNAMYAYGADPNAYYQYYYQQQQFEDESGNSGTLDVEALNQLGGKRRGEHAGVNIIDVNQSDMLPTEEWRRQAEAYQPKLPVTTETFEVNSLKKKKNNIMALAAQAKSMESTLEERYAQERIAKQQARKRYGF
ncbi:uncharacterized protein BX664DRAFT_321594 [Halteromyces radiatus]|uniref:uncharacterized protein n=1 Tax=Halteromyces radiatus TaxID=101107 RepID=UPI002220259E|nr:uncharacterized protein BX664DRAFT_321594 [Halteromyces radiatus]KAI8099556.1 hypothetical protein BX664DRAFT_321594 [Halteromyces radiatus]